jgi:hypothetical protein
MAQYAVLGARFARLALRLATARSAGPAGGNS